MACRHVSKRDALATVNPSNREGKTSACGVESQKNKKKPRRTDGEEIASRRASNAPPGSCSWLAQPNPTTTVWAYRWGGRPQGGPGLGAVAPRCIGKGVSDLVSYRHQNEVLYRLWGRLVLKQPQALCELDRPFVKIYRYIWYIYVYIVDFFFTASLCSVGLKREKLPSSDDKSLSFKKQKLALNR